MKRRAALKVVTLGALVPIALPDSGKAYFENAAWAPAGYSLHFFTQEENALLDQLMEMIIPADAHSPGAHAAQVSLFADLMVSTSNNKIKGEWRNGIASIRKEAAQSSLAEALSKAAAHEDNSQTPLEHFFVLLKEMTVNGYYTSAIGIHQDLQYQGNTYVNSFPGCRRRDITG